MPRRTGSKNIGIQLTPEEFTALNVFAKVTGRDKSEVVRAALAAYISGYPGNVWQEKEKVKNS